MFKLKITSPVLHKTHETMLYSTQFLSGYNLHNSRALLGTHASRNICSHLFVNIEFKGWMKQTPSQLFVVKKIIRIQKYKKKNGREN